MQTQNHAQKRRSAKYSVSYTSCIETTTCTGAKLDWDNAHKETCDSDRHTHTRHTEPHKDNEHIANKCARKDTPTYTDKPPHTQPNRCK